ncbi:hypothetical protein S7335_1964 [Synechococcus sp. PCC 7335]|uniref:hypothetical protein n=1 Tax=Synechococcus sp. (strain ATCC 29403 / PCC 7335) TaxID=91464 RepID=UPI00017ED920|nr:hypothetical protein [Synechococcus sp. PCC 7335]EDX84267.1 hypothetical protein S7335_1964 [Synechococcus sp. PCC 7335]
MTALSTAIRNTLDTQHTLQCQDLSFICQLADAESNVENTLEQIQSWSFEQFFGFACHLFVTTESSSIRKQLANLFPKFGKISILSLVKIMHYFDAYKRNRSYSGYHFPVEVQVLAGQALENMPAQILVVGLAQVIEEDAHSELRETIAVFLAKVFYKKEEDVLSLLSQRLSKDSWHAIEASLVRELSSPQHERVISGRFNNIHSSQASPSPNVLQLIDVA